MPVSTLSRAYRGITGSSVAQPKCKKCLVFMELCCLEYASSNQVVGSSNLSGRTKINKLDAMFLGAVLLTKLNSTMNFPQAARPIDPGFLVYLTYNVKRYTLHT